MLVQRLPPLWRVSRLTRGASGTAAAAQGAGAAAARADAAAAPAGAAAAPDSTAAARVEAGVKTAPFAGASVLS